MAMTSPELPAQNETSKIHTCLNIHSTHLHANRRLDSQPKDTYFYTWHGY